MESLKTTSSSLDFSLQGLPQWIIYFYLSLYSTSPAVASMKVTKDVGVVVDDQLSLLWSSGRVALLSTTYKKTTCNPTPATGRGEIPH